MQDKTSTKVSIPDLIAIEAGPEGGDPTWLNDLAFEGVVTDLKVFGANGSFKGTLKQSTNPMIKIAVIFRKMNPAQYEGKLCRFSGKGMLRSDYKHKFGVTPQVSIGDSTTIEVVAVSAHTDRPLPLPASGTPETRQDASGSPRMPANGNSGAPDESKEPLEDRVDTWFKAFDIVCRTAGAEPELMKSSLTATDFKEITTGTIMSFKAAYGMHAKPHFRGPGYSTKALASMPEKSWEGDKVTTWKDVKHPKTGEPLSSISAEKALALARWALTAQPKETERHFHGSVLMMAGSHKWDNPKTCLATSIVSDPGYGEMFTDEDVKTYFQGRLGGELQTAEDVEILDLIAHYKDVMDGILLAASNRTDNLDMSGIPF